MRKVITAMTIAAGVLVAPAAWATDWDESVNGDLSGNRLNPTVLNLTTGNNTITASSSAPDLEYYPVNLPPGTRLTSITLTQFRTMTTVAFIGVQSGTTFTEPPMGTNAANLLGWTHFGTGQLNTDILDNMGQAVPSIGFTPPLGNGTYTFGRRRRAPTRRATGWCSPSRRPPSPASGRCTRRCWGSAWVGSACGGFAGAL